MYAITAQIQTYEQDGNARAWSGSRQIPTFYLDENVQGITDTGHAVRIARQIIDPFSALNVTVTAERVTDA